MNGSKLRNTKTTSVSDKFQSYSNQKRVSDKFQSYSNQKHGRKDSSGVDPKSGKRSSSFGPPSPSLDDIHISVPEIPANGSSHKASPAKETFGKDGSPGIRSLNTEDSESQQDCASGGRTIRPPTRRSQSKVISTNFSCNLSFALLVKAITCCKAFFCSILKVFPCVVILLC